MKAVYFEQTGGLAQLQVGAIDRREPDLQPGELRLEFLAGSLNHLDLWVIRGLPHLKMSFPHIAGADLCARVLESRSEAVGVGEEVIVYPAESQGRDSRGRARPENLCSDFRIRGESMPGVFCERAVVHERYLKKKPEHLSAEEAASLPLVFLTAWQMLTEKAGFFPGRFDPAQVGELLVHSAGSGVSQALLALLDAMGFKKIFVSSRSPDKLKALSTNLSVEPILLSDGWAEKLRKRKIRFSVIFDHVGESVFEENLQLLEYGSRLVTCGASSGYRAALDLRQLFFRQLQLLGSTMGSLNHFREVIDFVVVKKIRPQIDQVFSFDDAREAYARLESGEQFGKVVLHSPEL